MPEPDGFLFSKPVDLSAGWVDLGATEEGYQWPDLGLPLDLARAAEGGSFTTEGRSAPISFSLDKISRNQVELALTGDASWTIGDALGFLDPAPPRRTLSRWLRQLTPVGTRELPQGGPAARTYRATEVMRLHAKWAKNHGESSGGTPGGDARLGT